MLGTNSKFTNICEDLTFCGAPCRVSRCADQCPVTNSPGSACTANCVVSSDTICYDCQGAGQVRKNRLGRNDKFQFTQHTGTNVIFPDISEFFEIPKLSCPITEMKFVIVSQTSGSCATGAACGLIFNAADGVETTTDVTHGSLVEIQARNCGTGIWVKSETFNVDIIDCSTQMPTKDPGGIAASYTFQMISGVAAFILPPYTGRPLGCEYSGVDVATTNGGSTWPASIANPTVISTTQVQINVAAGHECTLTQQNVYLNYKIGPYGLPKWLAIGKISLIRPVQLTGCAFPAGVTASQRVDVNDNNSLLPTKAVLQVCVLTVPACTIQSASTNNPGLMWDGSSIVPVDKSLHQVYTFVQTFHFVGGLSQTLPTSITLDVGCTLVNFTQNPVYNSSRNVFIIADSSPIDVYDYLPNAAIMNPSYCLITQVQIQNVKTNGVADPSAAYIDPNQIQPFGKVSLLSSSDPKQISFEIVVTVSGGRTYTELAVVQINVQCNQIADAFTQQTYSVELKTNAQMNLLPFTCIASFCCQPVYYKISPTSSLTSFIVPRLALQSVNSPSVQVETSTLTTTPITFYMYGQTSDLKAAHISAQLSVSVVCLTTTTSISFIGFPFNLTANQAAEQADLDARNPTRFVMYKPNSSEPQCNIVQFEVEGNPPELLISEDPQIGYVIKPTNIHFKKVYNFRVKAVALGGAYSISGWYSLDVGNCNNAIISETMQNRVITVTIGDPTDYAFIYRFPKASYRFCAVERTEVIDVMIGFDRDNTQAFFDPSCIQPCQGVNLRSTMILETVRFSIKSTFNDQKTFISPEVMIIKVCDKYRNEIQPYFEKTKVTIYQLSLPPKDSFKFPPFNCSQPACCEGENTPKYYLSSSILLEDNIMRVEGLQIERVKKDIYVRPISSGLVATYKFFIFANNTLGSYVFSQPLFLEVIPIPYNQTVLNETIQTGELQKPVEAKIIKEKLSARIESISSRGEVLIRWNHQMIDQNLGIDLKILETKALALTILPCADTQELIKRSELTSKELLNYEWSVVRFEVNELVLQLYFDYPLLISNSPDQRDQLEVTILDDFYFQDLYNEKKMEEKGKTLVANIKKQLNISQRDKTLLKIQNQIMNGIFVAGSLEFMLSFFLGITVQCVVTTIHVLHITTFQSLIGVNIPSNAIMFQQWMASILNFEIIPPEYTTVQMFDIQPDIGFVDLVNQAKIITGLSVLIQEFGLETFNPMLNVGGLFILILLFLAQILAVVLAEIIKKAISLYKSARNQYEGGSKIKSFVSEKLKKHKKGLFFNSPITIIQESILQITLAGVLFMTLPKQGWKLIEAEAPFTAKCQQLFGWFCIGAAGLHLFHSLVIVLLPHKTLEHPKMVELQGNIYQDLILTSKLKLMYQFLFASRRVLLAVIIITLQQIPGAQLVFWNLFNVIMTIYIMNAKPFKNRSKNTIEIINETIVYMLSITMTAFSEQYSDLEVKYNLGWVFILLILSCIMLNFFPFLHKIVYYARLIVVKYCIRLNQKLKQIKQKIDQIKLPKMPTSPKKNQLDTVNILVIDEEVQPAHRPTQTLCGFDEVNIFNQMPQQIQKRPKTPVEMKIEQDDITQFIDREEKNLVNLIQSQLEKDRNFQMEAVRIQLAQPGANISQIFDEAMLTDEEKVRLFYEYNFVRTILQQFERSPESKRTKKITDKFVKREVDSFINKTKQEKIIVTDETEMDQKLTWHFVKTTYLSHKQPLGVEPCHFFVLKYDQRCSGSIFGQIDEETYQQIKQRFYCDLELSDFNNLLISDSETRKKLLVYYNWNVFSINLMYDQIRKLVEESPYREIPRMTNAKFSTIWKQVKNIHFKKFTVQTKV